MPNLIPIGLVFASMLTLAESATRFASGPHRVALLELYTSEGCSSCPRADAWLSRLKNDNRLWKQVVPVAFHVDYWDRLGWPDRFARREWTERQHRYARHWKSGRIYTPGFVLNGNDRRGFFTGSPLPAADKSRPGELSIESTEKGEWLVIFRSATGKAPKKLQVHLALIAFDQNSDVGAGENRGRRLSHDFLVQQLTSKALNPETSQTIVQMAMPTTAGRYGLAAWLTAGTDPTPIQSTGGWLPSLQGSVGR